MSAAPLPLVKRRAPEIPTTAVVDARAAQPGSQVVRRADVVPERRRSAWKRLEIDVDMLSQHNFFIGFSANVSEGGLFVATHIPRKIGDLVLVTFSLPGKGPPIQAMTEVRWVRDRNDESDLDPGLGLRFIDISDASLARISAFIRATRTPLFYDDAE